MHNKPNYGMLEKQNNNKKKDISLLRPQTYFCVCVGVCSKSVTKSIKSSPLYYPCKESEEKKTESLFTYHQQRNIKKILKK